MTIEDFLDSAIEEGWQPTYTRTQFTRPFQNGITIQIFEDYYFLLDREIWKAVAKNKNWKRPTDPETGEEMLADPSEVFDQELWKDKWHDFIDGLAEGKTIEEALADI